MTLDDFLAEWRNEQDKVLVHTSGSTGAPKPLWVEKRRMEASARITCDFLHLQPGDTALLCMPLDYIAGKMVVVRSLVRHLRLINVSPSGHPLKGLTETPTFAAMVPMQVYNSLQVAEERERLCAIRHLIIGGGAIDDDLACQLKDFPNFVWSTYGMTETLSHIALRRLNGDEASLWYTPFASVSVSLNGDGCLVIDAPEVCAHQLTTHDIAELSPDGRQFRILGRMDNVIDSGGIKIQIEEAERLLRSHLSTPFMITKVPDAKYGEAVTLLYEQTTLSVTALREICESHLPRFWSPRHYLEIPSLPLTETGKPARKKAEKMAEERLHVADVQGG